MTISHQGWIMTWSCLGQGEGWEGSGIVRKRKKNAFGVLNPYYYLLVKLNECLHFHTLPPALMRVGYTLFSVQQRS